LESYQSIGIVLGVIGIILGLLGSLVQGWLVWVAIISIAGIIVVLVNTKHSHGFGITLIVFGIVGNLLLIIPGIMALRYKPETKSEIKPQSREEGDK
jgi:membrane-bound ClpP family serine protease